MAGIVGIGRSGCDALVRAALDRIGHRGRAGVAVHSYAQATFGRVWPEVQAQTEAEGTEHAVAVDGEIHNLTELAPGAACVGQALDTAYQQTGPAFVSKIDGPFALAIAGPEGLFLARDLVGKSPLYYGWHGGDLCFASEVKGLLGWATGIREFPPGHFYDVAHGLAPYAQIARRPPTDEPAARVAGHLRNLLEVSVQKRLAGGEVGTWLSGGIDSAALTAVARGQVSRLQTFSVGLADAPDLAAARAVANFLGTVHHERLCTLDELLAALPTVIYHLESFDALLVRSSLMNFLVGKLAAEHVPAVLSGEGGDELFAGYDYLHSLDHCMLPEELVDITRRLHNTALQRVDRCSASHGLVARTGFLDGAVLEYALQIPPEMKIHRNGSSVEKWILRRAVADLLPDDIVWRPKSKFWQGSGVGEHLARHAEQAISDEEFARARALPDCEPLATKEELFYYRVFSDCFGDRFPPSLVGRTKAVPVVH